MVERSGAERADCPAVLGLAAASPNSLRSLRSLRSDSGDEHVDERASRWPQALCSSAPQKARQLLEGGVLRALDGRAGTTQLDRVRALVEDEKAAYDAGNWSAWVRLSGEYHLQLAGLLGNSEIDTILRSLVARTTLMKALYHSHTANVCSFDEHTQILDAMQAGDLDRSCRLMHAHLHGAQSKLQQNRSPENVDLLALFQGTD